GSPANPRVGTGNGTTTPGEPNSDAPLLGRAAAVVRERGHVFDGLDVKPGSLESGDRGLAASSRTFHPHFDLFDTKLGSLGGTLLGRPLSGERRALAAALEPNRTARRVTQRVAVGVGDGDDRVVERALHVGNATADVAAGF